MSQPSDLAAVYVPRSEVIDSVFEKAGLTIEKRYQVGKSTFVVAQKRSDRSHVLHDHAARCGYRPYAVRSYAKVKA
jgi:hypothetical protein